MPIYLYDGILFIKKKRNELLLHSSWMTQNVILGETAQSI